MRTYRVRVAAIVQAQPSLVREAAATLPDNVTAYVVETGAGVLVTLERGRGLRSRRRAIRSLERQLAEISATAPGG
jgi:hypothetical protein